MSDEQAPPEPAAANEPRGPLVAPELVPAIEQAAVRAPAPLWQSAGVALLVLALLAAIGAGIVAANDRWGDAAQTMTAAQGFRALVSGDADAFLALVESDVRPRIKRADIVANRELGRGLIWVGPFFVDERRVRLVAAQGTGSAAGTAVFTPDPARADLVQMTASGGPFGEASGTIQLARTLDGWRITAYRFHAFVEPTATPAAK